LRLLAMAEVRRRDQAFSGQLLSFWKSREDRRVSGAASPHFLVAAPPAATRGFGATDHSSHLCVQSTDPRSTQREERRHLAGGAPASRRQQLPSRSGTTAARLTRRRALGESRPHRIPAAGHREVAREPMTIMVCASSAKLTPPLLSAVERSRRSWGGCVVPRATCRRATARVVLPPKRTRAGAPADHSSRFNGSRRDGGCRRRDAGAPWL
jgi:hypothetical protein